MALAAWCSECHANVWVSPDGGCSHGHPRSCLRGLREVPGPAASLSHPGMPDSVPVEAPASAQAVAKAQKAVIVAIVMNVVFSTLGTTGLAGLILALAASALTTIAVYTLSSALDDSMTTRVLYAVVTLVPIANLVFVLGLLIRATKVLRSAGYSVGLLGAKL